MERRQPGDRAIRIYPKQFLLSTYGLDDKALGYYIKLVTLCEGEPVVPKATARAAAASPYLSRRYARDLEGWHLVAIEAGGIRLNEWDVPTSRWRLFGRPDHGEPIAAVSLVTVAEARVPLPKAVRDYVIDRDGRTCGICGRYVSPEEALDIDHIHPVAAGGTDDPDNLQVSHASCNRRKGARVLGGAA